MLEKQARSKVVWKLLCAGSLRGNGIPSQVLGIDRDHTIPNPRLLGVSALTKSRSFLAYIEVVVAHDVFILVTCILVPSASHSVATCNSNPTSVFRRQMFCFPHSPNLSCKIQIADKQK